MVVSEAATLADIQPVPVWNTPIAWTGYILFADGLVWYRRGSSWLTHARAEFLFLAFASVPLWLIFELYNRTPFTTGTTSAFPRSIPLRYAGYAWSFATIWPAIFESGTWSPHCAIDGPTTIGPRRPSGTGSTPWAG